MDTALASPEPFLATPQAEMLEELLQAQLGPLPRLAAICRLKRLPSGGYSSTDDLHLVLERRRVANAKERERVRVPGHLTPTPCLPSRPSWVTSSSRGLARVPSSLLTLHLNAAARAGPWERLPHLLTLLDGSGTEGAEGAPRQFQTLHRDRCFRNSVSEPWPHVCGCSLGAKGVL